MATVTTTTSAGLPVSMMAATPHHKLRVAGTQLCLVQTVWVVEDLGSAVGLGVCQVTHKINLKGYTCVEEKYLVSLI